MILRPYQSDMVSRVYEAWSSGARVVMPVIPTGGGKTAVFTHIMAQHKGASCALAHRSELVSQMSLALARNGLYHKIIGQNATARNCTAIQLAELNRNYVTPQARVAAASVQTLIRRDPNDPWFREVTLIVIDEGHHLLEANAWGKAAAMFPNAIILTPTATPGRADGKGLGRHADGLVDVMLMGPTMRQLITDGHLTDYRLIAPPSDIDLTNVPISASGDFSPQPLASAVHKSHIVGDVVEHYKRFALGKLGVTFTVDLEAARETALAYRNAGVRAEVISGETPDMLRANLMHRFRARQIDQLVTVDVLGEGVDVPAIEVISLARPTQSLGLHLQQCGRGLRPMEGKDRAIIIDHVNNWQRHGLPDAPRIWTLDRRERRTRNAPDDAIPLRVCPKCLGAYERILTGCPYCGAVHVPVSRGGPAEVDGDLQEIDPSVLARMRGEVDAVDAAPKIPYGAAPEIVGAIHKRHRERRDAQHSLRSVMSMWGGFGDTQGWDMGEQQRRFYHTFGVDVLSAQAHNKAESVALENQVREWLMARGVLV